MTESDYFNALHDLLPPALKDVPKAVGGHYVIEEVDQVAFSLVTRGLCTHECIKLEAIKTDWPCFRSGHRFAHRRCDRIVVAWDRTKNAPKFLLIELKSGRPRGAFTQLGASLAFCHWIHRMVCVGHTLLPHALFGAVTVSTTPFALKTLSSLALPSWNQQPLQLDCKHMHFNRSGGILPVAAVLASV